MSIVLLDWPPPPRCPGCNEILPCAACGEPHEPRRKWPKRCAKIATHRLATATRAGWRCEKCGAISKLDQHGSETVLAHTDTTEIPA